MALPGRSTQNVATASFIADQHSIDRIPGGRMIDWTHVTAGTAGAVLLANGKLMLPAGCAVGDLLGSGAVSPRVVTTNPAIGFLETDAIQDSLIHAATGVSVIVGGVLFENLLPDATGGPPKVLASAIKTEVQTAGVGTGFSFHEYQDVR